VTFVDYQRAVSYCLWLASETGTIIGLPTEAQWEKAAAWDPVTATPRPYPWGSAPASYELFRFYEGPDPRPASPVGSYPLGASAYGAMDMAGNVWEWTADWYDADYYKRTGVATDPIGPATGAERVTRGGSWRVEARLALSTVRNPAKPNISGDSLGFRCAMNGSRPVDTSNIFLTPVDLTAGLAKLVQQVPPDSGNDPAVLADWLAALGNLQQSLQSGDHAQALTIISQRAQVLPGQKRDNLIMPGLAWQLERGLIWVETSISSTITSTTTTSTELPTQSTPQVTGTP
jgi:sulfatase-modifying factor enzyme 1